MGRLHIEEEEHSGSNSGGHEQEQPLECIFFFFSLGSGSPSLILLLFLSPLSIFPSLYLYWPVFDILFLFFSLFSSVLFISFLFFFFVSPPLTCPRLFTCRPARLEANTASSSVRDPRSPRRYIPSAV